MSGLKDLLLERIRQDGPLTVADYMAACLFDPRHGYYSTREPFGAAGDFITAPEISQMFGELLGLALAQAWVDQGAPAPFVLAEFGPGRGTLMADVLRATRRVPGFHAAMRLCLLEASERLRAVQQAALPGAAPVWIDAPEDLPEAPLFLVANEFFDALPIRQFLRVGAGWRERLVGAQGGDLVFGLSEPLPGAGFDPRFAGDPPGTLVELCPAARPYVAAVAARIRAHGGLAIFADYGGWRSGGDTLQALRRHRPADPLAEPGAADLTAHVDFEALALAAGPGVAHSYAAQGDVLRRLGIEARTKALARGLVGAALENHLAAARRLTAPAEMGELFRMLALFPADAPQPPGFA